MKTSFERPGAPCAMLALMLGWPSAVSAAEPSRADTASGAPGAAPTAAEKDTARSLARDGDTFFAEGQYEPALARYAAAYHLVRVPTLGLSVAKSRAALGRLAEALAVAREVERMPVQAGEPPVFASARLKAKELAVDLGARVPRLQVEVAPAGIEARISIDGVAVPLASSSPGVELDAGLHRLVVSADGYSNVELEFELHERDRERLPVTLFARAGQAAPAAAAAAKEAAGTTQPSVAPRGPKTAKAMRAAMPPTRRSPPAREAMWVSHWPALGSRAAPSLACSPSPRNPTVRATRATRAKLPTSRTPNASATSRRSALRQAEPSSFTASGSFSPMARSQKRRPPAHRARSVPH